MTLSSTATVEELIPGSPAAIEAAVENLGAGVEPARQIGQAWQVMTLPGWEGRGGDAWRVFVPKEAGHVNVLPPAFNRVAAAMLRYQAAFQAARAAAQGAIEDAKVAELATQAARREHQLKAREAATADPGTPEATVAPFADPGASKLAAAQTRLDTARATLTRVGDEVAAEIRVAAGAFSGVGPSLSSGAPSIVPVAGIPPKGLPKPNTDAMDAVGEFLTGFFGEAWDTIVGLAQLLPIVQLPHVIEELFTPEGWERQGQQWDAFVNDPGGVLGTQWEQIWKSLTYADLWEDHPVQASGRVTFAALTLLLPLAKLGKLGKVGGLGGEASAGVARLTVSQQALIDQLIKSGVKVSPEKVIAIAKTPQGKIVWLEEGTVAGPGRRASGLAHVIESHGHEFAKKGVSEAQIPDLLMKAVKDGNIVGYQGAGTGRPIYQVDFNGKALKIAITVGDNGYIVGANIAK